MVYLKQNNKIVYQYNYDYNRSNNRIVLFIFL